MIIKMRVYECERIKELIKEIHTNVPESQSPLVMISPRFSSIPHSKLPLIVYMQK